MTVKSVSQTVLWVVVAVIVTMVASVDVSAGKPTHEQQVLTLLDSAMNPESYGMTIGHAVMGVWPKALDLLGYDWDDVCDWAETEPYETVSFFDGSDWSIWMLCSMFAQDGIDNGWIFDRMPVNRGMCVASVTFSMGR